MPADIGSHRSGMGKIELSEFLDPACQKVELSEGRATVLKRAQVRSRGGALAYNSAAVVSRKCLARRRDGERCEGWAIWGFPKQVCRARSGLPRARYLGPGEGKGGPAKFVPCLCVAYKWPHRPGGGLCCWPLPPKHRCTTPAGTHREWRWVCRQSWRLERSG
jgi:hypothetical protein